MTPKHRQLFLETAAIGGALVIAVIAWLAYAIHKDNQLPEIQADVRLGRFQMEITNRGVTHWHGLTITLDGGYGLTKNSRIKPGETVLLKLQEFANGGEWFQPSLRTPKTITVEAPDHQLKFVSRR